MKVLSIKTNNHEEHREHEVFRLLFFVLFVVNNAFGVS